MPRLATSRQTIQVARLAAQAQAQAKGPRESVTSVSSRVRVRPMRSPTLANAMPPIDGPAEQQQRRDHPRPTKGGGFRRGGADRRPQQAGHCMGGDEVEQKANRDVEAPSQPGGQKHQPLLSVEMQGQAQQQRLGGVVAHAEGCRPWGLIQPGVAA